MPRTAKEELVSLLETNEHIVLQDVDDIKLFNTDTLVLQPDLRVVKTPKDDFSVKLKGFSAYEYVEAKGEFRLTFTTYQPDKELKLEDLVQKAFMNFRPHHTRVNYVFNDDNIGSNLTQKATDKEVKAVGESILSFGASLDNALSKEMVNRLASKYLEDDQQLSSSKIALRNAFYFSLPPERKYLSSKMEINNIFKRLEMENPQRGATAKETDKKGATAKEAEENLREAYEIEGRNRLEQDRNRLEQDRNRLEHENIEFQIAIERSKQEYEMEMTKLEAEQKKLQDFYSRRSEAQKEIEEQEAILKAIESKKAKEKEGLLSYIGGVFSTTYKKATSFSTTRPAKATRPAAEASKQECDTEEGEDLFGTAKNVPGTRFLIFNTACIEDIENLCAVRVFKARYSGDFEIRNRGNFAVLSRNRGNFVVLSLAPEDNDNKNFDLEHEQSEDLHLQARTKKEETLLNATHKVASKHRVGKTKALSKDSLLAQGYGKRGAGGLMGAYTFIYSPEEFTRMAKAISENHPEQLMNLFEERVFHLNAALSYLNAENIFCLGLIKEGLKTEGTKNVRTSRMMMVRNAQRELLVREIVYICNHIIPHSKKYGSLEAKDVYLLYESRLDEKETKKIMSSFMKDINPKASEEPFVPARLSGGGVTIDAAKEVMFPYASFGKSIERGLQPREQRGTRDFSNDPDQTQVLRVAGRKSSSRETFGLNKYIIGREASKSPERRFGFAEAAGEQGELQSRERGIRQEEEQSEEFPRFFSRQRGRDRSLDLS